MSETAEETLTDKANRLAREAVKREMEKHVSYSPQSHTKTGPVIYCKHDGEGWPCRVVSEMDAAEEAISEAEEEEERIANGPYYCGVEVRAMRYVDPEPAEYCENEVDNEGEHCDKHGEPDEDDDAYDRMKDARYDD